MAVYGQCPWLGRDVRGCLFVNSNRVFNRARAEVLSQALTKSL